MQPPPPQGVNAAPNDPKLYTSSGKDISKCIEGGSMKLATQVDFILLYLYSHIVIHLCSIKMVHVLIAMLITVKTLYTTQIINLCTNPI